MKLLSRESEDGMRRKKGVSEERGWKRQETCWGREDSLNWLC